MDCRQLQDELVGSSAPDKEAQEHLDGCSECRRFAADLALFGTLRDASPETPVILRGETLDRCHEILAKQTAASGLAVWRRCRRLCESPRFIVTVAGLGVVILGWWLAVQAPGLEQGSESLTSIKLAFLQIGLQNFFAALLFPAVWMMRSTRRRHHSSHAS